MYNKFQNSSMQVKIMSFFIFISIVLTSAFIIAFYNSTLSNALENKEIEMSSLANIASSKIDRFIFERTADLQVLSKSNIFTTPEINESVQENYLKNIMDAYQTYDAFFTYDTNDHTQIKIGNPDLEYLSDDTIRNFKSDQSFVSDIVEINSSRYIYFSEPITDSNNRYIFSIVGKMNFLEINALLSDIQFGNSGHALLENIDQKYEFDIITSDEQKYYVVSEPLHQYDTQKNEWHIEIRQLKDEVLSIKDKIGSYLSFIVILTLILFSSVSYYISKRITRPVKLLRDRIRDLMHQNNIQSNMSDEMKSLTFSFDYLLSELHFMMQQVLEQSGEIASNKELRKGIEYFVEDVSYGFITLDSNLVITSINPIALDLLKLDAISIVNQSIQDDLPEHVKNFFSNVLNNIKADEYNQNNNSTIRYHNDTIHLINSIIPKEDSKKNVIGYTLMIRCLDDKKAFEQSIIRAKKLSELGELSAGVAHEIRNPLASIKGYAQIALKDAQNEPQLSDDLKVILQETDRLEHILDRFLTFARPNMPKYDLCHLNKLVKSTIKQVQKGLQLGNVQIKHRFTLYDELIIDSEQIKQVLLNVILNAIQSMTNGGVIEIMTSVDPTLPMAEIVIIDQGEGIDEANLNSIYKPFFTTRTKGTGLGLSICSRIIENHKGFIKINSKKGDGTQVMIKLPLKETKIEKN